MTVATDAAQNDDDVLDLEAWSARCNWSTAVGALHELAGAIWCSSLSVLLMTCDTMPDEERWQSGRMRQTRNLVYVYAYLGFKSLSLRQYLDFELAQRDSKLVQAPHHAGLCA